MMPLWLRRGIAMLPPVPKPIPVLALTEYLPEFAGPDDGPRITWFPEKSPQPTRNERTL